MSPDWKRDLARHLEQQLWRSSEHSQQHVYSLFVHQFN